MAVFDDMELDRKVTVYDKGDWQTPAGRISTHAGDVWIPRIDAREPLAIACTHFLEAVASGSAPRTNVDEGLRVVEVLEAMQTSLERGGETIALRAAAR
jgi:predicted dehydrogenase